jgi:predicted ATPase
MNADAAMEEAFALGSSHDEDPVLHIEARQIRARRKAGGMVWFDFKTLCGGPRSQNDYLEIASLVPYSIPERCTAMSVRMASEARRFTWLIDVLYDRRVKLVVCRQRLLRQTVVHRGANGTRISAHGVRKRKILLSEDAVDPYLAPASPGQSPLR